MSVQIKHEHWGQISYQDAWDRQEKLFKHKVHLKSVNRELEQQNLPPVEQEHHLITCEHTHVYTIGKSGDEANLLIPPDDLWTIEANYVRTNRGGDITYHGPGQLVCYPILDLDFFFTDIHRYMRYLEESVILTLSDFDIKAGRIAGLTGVWIDYGGSNPRKICAMGVKASRWVTMHGLALNVNTDLTYFGHIIPCGITDKAVTSMEQELSKPVDFEDVREVWLQKFSEVFGCTLR